MHNHGAYIIVSLGEVCAPGWANEAEALGVEIYPGFAAAEMLYGEAGEVLGVVTGDMGREADGSRRSPLRAGHGAARGLYADRRRRAQFADARNWSSASTCARRVAAKIRDRLQGTVARAGRTAPAGLVQHTLGWPLGNAAGGGSFSTITATGWWPSASSCTWTTPRPPHLSPFGEFQRFKMHPQIRPLLAGAERLGYGARAIAEGLQSCPNWSSPAVR